MNLLTEENITGFCGRRWNALAAGLMPARHEYLAALDAHSAGVNHYCVLEEDDAYLCAARLTVSTGTDLTIAATLYGRAVRAAAGLGLAREELVVCGWTPGQGSNIILDRSLPATQQEEMIERICDRIERIAGERAVVFASVQLRDEVLARVLSGRGYCVASDRSVACLDVEWDGAAGYLTALGVRRIWLGNAAYEAKIRRGCRIIPSRVFMRLPTKLGKALHRPAFALQRAWSGWKYRRYLGSGTS
jgi:hypothetical protein